MDARLSAEQHALREAAAKVVADLAPQTVLALDDRERAAKLGAAIGAAGWRDLRSDSGNGTPWASAVEVAIVAEELGRGPADAAFSGPTLAAELRRLAGAPGESRIETVLFDASLAAPARTSAEVVPPRAVAIDAAGASTALSLTERGHVVEATVAPDSSSADLTRPFACVVPSERVAAVAAASRPVAGDALVKWTAFGLALTSADLVGTMRGALSLACEYAKTRRQYGATIGSFQAVQHLLADALVATEGSQSIMLHAAWAVDALPPADALAAAAAAKAYCSRAARIVCEMAIQVHGGIGNTWDCLAHVYLRRALLSTDILGGVGANLARTLDARGIGEAHGFR